MIRNLYSASRNNSFNKATFSTATHTVKRVLFALFLPLSLLLSGTYLAPAQFSTSGKGQSGNLGRKETSDLVVLHRKTISTRRTGGVLCPTDTEEQENEDFAGKKNQTPDEEFSSGDGLFKTLFLAAFDSCTSLKKRFTRLDLLSDQFANKRYILIQVFRI